MQKLRLSNRLLELRFSHILLTRQENVSMLRVPSKKWSEWRELRINGIVLVVGWATMRYSVVLFSSKLVKRSSKDGASENSSSIFAVIHEASHLFLFEPSTACDALPFGNRVRNIVTVFLMAPQAYPCAACTHSKLKLSTWSSSVWGSRTKSFTSSVLSDQRKSRCFRGACWLHVSHWWCRRWFQWQKIVPSCSWRQCLIHGTSRRQSSE